MERDESKSSMESTRRFKSPWTLIRRIQSATLSATPAA
jgi:hypothetical protein